MHSFTQLALIWGGALAASVVARTTRLTPVVYYLGIGCLFVNLGLMPEESDPFIRDLAELGIVLIMFAIGFEERTANFLSSLKKSWGIAFFGALAPFLTAFGLTYAYWGDARASLLCGLAMTATAVSLTMVSLRGEGLADSPVATRIMTSAVIDDIASLALVAIVVPVATGVGELSVEGIGTVVGKAVLFFVLVSVISNWVFPHDRPGWLGRVPVLGQRGIRDMLQLDQGRLALLQVLLMAVVAGMLAEVFGFHPAVGAYMAGLILREEYFSQPGCEGNYAETRRVVDSLAFSTIGPVFFVLLGAELVFDGSLAVAVLPEAVLLFVCIAVAQIISAGLAARMTGGMSREESVMVGLGMLGRAELAFVVMDIAFVQHGLITLEAFYLLMLTCFFLNVTVPLSIRWYKPYYDAAQRSAAAGAAPGPAEIDAES